MLLTPKYIFTEGFRDLEGWFYEQPHKIVSFRQQEYL